MNKLHALGYELDLSNTPVTFLNVVTKPLSADLSNDHRFHVSEAFNHAKIGIAPINKGANHVV